MPRVIIDNREIDVPAGATLLDAARQLGIDVPALCYREGYRANTTCMACVVKVVGRDEGTKARRHEGKDANAGRSDEEKWRHRGKFVPSCATLAEDGMRVESETEEVHAVRRAALDLLLSDHAGECRAPCQHACPLGTDIPRMMRAVADERLDDAIAIVRDADPLPATLSRVAVAFSERACRRGRVDEPASISLMRRYVADADLASPAAHLPEKKPGSGRRVAIVGSGPAALSAAYFLQRDGYACTLIDSAEQAGGELRAFPVEELQPSVLDAEIALIGKLGARFDLSASIEVGRVEALMREYDAVLLTLPGLRDLAAHRLDDHAIVAREADGNLFGAANAVKPRSQVLLAVADGKAAAVCIDQFLRGEAVKLPPKLHSVHASRPLPDELAAMVADANAAPRVATPCACEASLSNEQACQEAGRCLHCDCHKFADCTLRKYAEMYGVSTSQYRGDRRHLQRRTDHPDVVFEPGKCILCGLCLQIAERAGEPIGLALEGRGFDTRVSVPFNEALGKALRTSAAECVAVCPTGAIAWKREVGEGRRDGGT